jgi:hypothetical protein
VRTEGRGQRAGGDSKGCGVQGPRLSTTAERASQAGVARLAACRGVGAVQGGGGGCAEGKRPCAGYKGSGRRAPQMSPPQTSGQQRWSSLESRRSRAGDDGEVLRRALRYGQRRGKVSTQASCGAVRSSARAGWLQSAVAWRRAKCPACCCELLRVVASVPGPVQFRARSTWFLQDKAQCGELMLVLYCMYLYGYTEPSRVTCSLTGTGHDSVHVAWLPLTGREACCCHDLATTMMSNRDLHLSAYFNDCPRATATAPQFP